MDGLKDYSDRDILVALHTQMKNVQKFMETHSKRLVLVERRLWVLAGIGTGVTFTASLYAFFVR
jgi:hypothetical protein